MLVCLAADMSTRTIIEAFQRWREQRMTMALATVFETLGSTYTKAGHRIIIAGSGEYSGLISGGCLEGDLAERAARVLQERTAQPVTYDLRDDVEDVFGLGVGCNGLIRVFIQPLLPERGYEPFETLCALYNGDAVARSATVIDSPGPGLPPGATFVRTVTGEDIALTPGADAQRLAALLAGEAAWHDAAVLAGRYVRGENYGVLIAPIWPIPRLLVLGAGLDAVPLVRMAAELGWYVDVVDHRPAYLERGDFTAADSLRLVDPRDETDVRGAGGPWDAAVVMSHHLETDAAYLRALARSALGYLGVLGPPARREKLLEKLEPEFADLRHRLRGPIGLDIGAHGAEPIALSILAELQSVFSAEASGTDGR
jgi:xanthine dehydrogenase accessory factor